VAEREWVEGGEAERDRRARGISGDERSFSASEGGRERGGGGDRRVGVPSFSRENSTISCSWARADSLKRTNKQARIQ
jgi:hypothetical protein